VEDPKIRFWGLNATIRTGLGGDLSPLERLIREGMWVDTGFSGKRGLCAKFADFGRW